MLYLLIYYILCNKGTFFVGNIPTKPILLLISTFCPMFHAVHSFRSDIFCESILTSE